MGSSSSGKGGGGASGSGSYNYYGSIAGAFCVGTVFEVTGIIIDDALAWSGSLLNSVETNPVSVSVEGRGVARIYFGRSDQTTTDALLLSGGNSLGDAHPAYTGIAYIVLQDFLFGLEKTMAPNIKVVFRRKPDQSLITGSAANLQDGQANPFCVLADLFTNECYGRGMSADMFSATPWQAAADNLYSRHADTYVSISQLSQEPGKKIGNSLFKLFDGFIRGEAATAKAEAGVFTLPESISAGSLTTFTAADMTELPSFSPGTWDDVNTRFVVSYSDREHNFKERSVKYDDPKARLAIGKAKALTLNRGYVTRAEQAMNHAVDQGRRNSLPSITGSISVRSEKAATVRPGHHIRIDIDAEPGGTTLQQVFRVESLTRKQSGVTTINVTSEATLTPIMYQEAATPATPVTGDVDEITTANLCFFACPPPLCGGNTSAIGIIASRPDELVTDFFVHYDKTNVGGEEFPLVARFRSFGLRCKIKTASNTTDDTIELDVIGATGRELYASSPGDVSARNNDMLLVVTNPDGGGWNEVEVLSVREFAVVSTNVITATCLRGRAGTMAMDLDVNSPAFIIRRDLMPWVNHEDFPENSVLGANSYFKIQPATAFLSRAIEDCDVETFKFTPTPAYAPLVTVTAPTPDSGQIYTSCALNATLTFTGTVTDADANLVYFVATAERAGVPTVIADITLAGIGEYAFSCSYLFATTGTYQMRFKAQDSTGHITEVLYEVRCNASGSKASNPVAYVYGSTPTPYGTYLGFGLKSSSATVNGGGSSTIVIKYATAAIGTPLASITYSDATVNTNPAIGTVLSNAIGHNFRVWTRAHDTSSTLSDSDDVYFDL